MSAKKSSGEKIFFEKQIYDLKQLLEISKSLNSTMDFPALIEAFLYICMGQFQTIGAALFTKPDFDATSFQLNQNFYGFDVQDSVDYSIPEEHPLIALLGKNPGCFTMAQILESGLEQDITIQALKSLEPTLIVPLKAKGKINGILVLGQQITEKPYSDYEKEHVLAMASLAAVAINNAMLLDMSTTDMMTHLKLKHFFYTVLDEKREICNNRGCALSVIMLDIDFFKRFNDTYGHACGDLVLQKVAEVIKKNTRAQDLAARYGGEEFVILLCETDAETAAKIADRIRYSIENMDIVHESQHLTVTISAGVAEYAPETDVSSKALVSRADKALYASKENGRNRVTVFSGDQMENR